MHAWLWLSSCIGLFDLVGCFLFSHQSVHKVWGVFFLADLQAAAAGVDDLGLESKGLARPCVNLWSGVCVCVCVSVCLSVCLSLSCSVNLLQHCSWWLNQKKKTTLWCFGCFGFSQKKHQKKLSDVCGPSFLYAILYDLLMGVFSIVWCWNSHLIVVIIFAGSHESHHQRWHTRFGQVFFFFYFGLLVCA